VCRWTRTLFTPAMRGVILFSNDSDKNLMNSGVRKKGHNPAISVLFVLSDEL
jgi:hypothetical protein